MTNDSLVTYSYDLNGNRTMSGYTTGPANELTSDGTWDYYYDRNGNQVGKKNISTGEAFSYGYDNKNRLVTMQDTTTSGVQMQGTYVYEALGQRIEKDVWTQSAGGTTTRFAYHKGEIWADLSSANALQTRYVRGGQVLELLARIVSGTAAWFLADRMGSVRNVVDNTGAVIDTITYDGYGNIVSETSPPIGGSYKAFGYRDDSETGLYRPDPSTGRYYIPVSGRWITQDPLGFAGGDTNLYGYVFNQPTDATDPSSLQCGYPPIIPGPIIVRPIIVRPIIVRPIIVHPIVVQPIVVPRMPPADVPPPSQVPPMSGRPSYYLLPGAEQFWGPYPLQPRPITRLGPINLGSFFAGESIVIEDPISGTTTVIQGVYPIGSGQIGGQVVIPPSGTNNPIIGIPVWIQPLPILSPTPQPRPRPYP